MERPEEPLSDKCLLSSHVHPFLQRRTYGGAFAHKCVVERHNSQTGTMENFARRERNTRKIIHHLKRLAVAVNTIA